MRTRISNQILAAYVERTRALAACITNRPLLVVRSRQIVGAHTLLFPPQDKSVRLRLADGGSLGLFAVIDVAVDADAAVPVRTVGYRFQLRDRENREFLAYHWHPGGVSPVREPHVHVSAATSPFVLGARQSLVFADHHWPTGVLSFAHIVRLLLAELQVVPRRTDWQRLVQEQLSNEDLGQ